MTLKKIKMSFLTLGSVTLAACNSLPMAHMQAQQPIIIQGALPIETEYLVQKLKSPTQETIGGWTFWKGTYQGYPMIISKTRMGMSNSAAATALAIQQYQPIAIINQGTAGGHDPALKVYDIVVGEYTTNIGAIKTPHKDQGAGANALEWNEAFDVFPENESNPEPIGIRRFKGDAQLINSALQVQSTYTQGKVVLGTLGAADVWNNELDRIALIRKNYGTSAEEMEGASVAQIAQQFNVPFVGIRVVSNNMTNQGKYDAGTGVAAQNFALDVAVQYMKNRNQ